MAITLKRPSAKLPKSGYLSALLWGLWAALGLCTTTLIANAMHYKTHEPHLFWHDVVFFLIMVYGVLNYRKKQGGFMSMRQVYLFCVSVGVVAALLFGVYVWIQAEYITLDWVEKYTAEQRRLLLEAEMSDIDRQKQLFVLSQAKSGWLACKTAIDFLLLSVFVPLIGAIFLKKEKTA